MFVSAPSSDHGCPVWHGSLQFNWTNAIEPGALRIASTTKCCHSVKREVHNIHLDIAARLHLALCPLQLITAWPQNTHTMWIHSYLHEQTQKFSGDRTVRDISSSLSSGQSMQLKKKEKGVKVISLMDLCIILGIKEVNYCYSVIREHVKRKKKKKNTVLVFFFRLTTLPAYFLHDYIRKRQILLHRGTQTNFMTHLDINKITEISVKCMHKYKCIHYVLSFCLSSSVNSNRWKCFAPQIYYSCWHKRNEPKSCCWTIINLTLLFFLSNK